LLDAEKLDGSDHGGIATALGAPGWGNAVSNYFAFVVPIIALARSPLPARKLRSI
jgi:hypothetical protein